MVRTTKVLTFSLPPEMLKQVRQVMEEEDRNLSQVIRESLRLYMLDRERTRHVGYRRHRARVEGIAPEHVEQLGDEHRAKGPTDRREQTQGGHKDE